MGFFLLWLGTDKHTIVNPCYINNLFYDRRRRFVVSTCLQHDNEKFTNNAAMLYSRAINSTIMKLKNIKYKYYHNPVGLKTFYN